jgi:hypothetical protein
MDSFILQDSFNYLRGKHSLKFGGEFLRYRYTSNDTGNVSGSYAFRTAETGLPGFTASTGNPYASFMIGAAHNGGADIFATEPGYFAGIYSLYAQDDFKATPKLTLNLGLRWEIPMPQTERKDQESGFNATLPNPGADNIPGAYEFLGNCSTCNGRHSFENWYFKEFGPRIGLAYAITNKLVFRGGYGISYAPPIENNWGAVDITGFNDSVNVSAGSAIHTTGFSEDPALYWSPLASASTGAARVGLPAYTGTLPNRTSTVANYGQYVDYLPRTGAAQPYTQNWSAGFQYMVPHDILLQADYMGSKGTRLVNYYFASLINQPAAKYMGLGDILADDLATDLADPVNGPILASYGITKLPYPDFENNNWSTSVNAAIQPYPQYGGIYNNQATYGSSTYHSLQLMARKNSKRGLNFIAAYTYSKLLTDSDAPLSYGGTQNVQDFTTPKAEKAIASFDYTHVLKLTWFYDLPFGRGQRWLNSGGALDRLVSGWQITAIQNYTSGDPLSISSSYGSGYVSSWAIRGDVIPGVPLKVANVGHLYLPPAEQSNYTQYLNPAAFADPPASINNGFALRYGNSPGFLSGVRGPMQMGGGENFGIVKNTRISERFKLEFRADMFNVFNRTRLGDPDTSLGDGMPDVVNGVNQGGTFGMVEGPQNGPRIIQFALRLTF